MPVVTAARAHFAPAPASPDDEIGELLEDLSPYVRYVADAFRLKDWEFIVEWDGSLDGSLATVRFTPRRRVGLVCVGPRFIDGDGEEQRHGICHELAHAHLESIKDAVNCIRGSLGQGVWEVLNNNLADQIETVADEWAAVGSRSLLTFDAYREHMRTMDACVLPPPSIPAANIQRKAALIPFPTLSMMLRSGPPDAGAAALWITRRPRPGRL